MSSPLSRDPLPSNGPLSSHDPLPSHDPLLNEGVLRIRSRTSLLAAGIGGGGHRSRTDRAAGAGGDPAGLSGQLLQQPGASFVTLRIGPRLRGCMGSLQATEPLVINVARNAFSAAFRRSASSPPWPAMNSRTCRFICRCWAGPSRWTFASEAELLSLIRPGIDGLTLSEGTARATLLPAVWKTVSDPREFLTHLKRKAGPAARRSVVDPPRRTLYGRIGGGG